jgi:signal transduction histidine kinase
MVTAMSNLRADVRASCRRVWVYDPCRCERVARALERLLDLELALMLGAYGRHATELAQRRDRALLPQRVARRMWAATRSGVDAALSYLELVARAPDTASRERWLARLKASLERVSTLDRRWGDGIAPADAEVAPTDLEALVMGAVREVSVPASTTVDVRVEPRHLLARVHPGPLKLALVELLQNAVNHDPGGTTVLDVRGRDGDLTVEVVDGGPGWPSGATTIADLLGSTGGLGLAYGEHVAELHGGQIELFHPPGRGAGVRLRLGPVRAAAPQEGP